MTVQEFKQQCPHLAHLEGDDLWNAMEMAVMRNQEPEEKLPDDNEVGLVIKQDGYTFEFSKGAVRLINKLFDTTGEPLLSDQKIYFVPPSPPRFTFGSPIPNSDDWSINFTGDRSFDAERIFDIPNDEYKFGLPNEIKNKLFPDGKE